MLAAGRVTDEDDTPYEGLVVTLHDGHARVADAGRARAVTGEDGSFAFHVPDENAPRTLAVRDAAGVRVLATRHLPADKDAEFPIVVARADATGWAVTLTEGRAARFTHGNAVRFLVDGEELFAELVRFADAARESLLVSQLQFKPEFTATFREDGTPGRKLVDALADAVHRGVDVRVLLNENAVLPDDVDELTDALRARGVDVTRVVHAVKMTVNVMHAKLFIADGRDAFLVSSTFEPRFWDAPTHAYADARRGSNQPLHHVSAHVTGPVVPFLAAAFADVWNERHVSRARERVGVPPAPARSGDATLQVIRTMPPRFTPGDARTGGETGILEAYLRAFALAERFIYLENQYFTSAVVTRVLLRVMDAKPDLQVILVGNEHVDIPGYDQWQRKRVHALRAHPRFEAFSLWSVGFDEDAHRKRVRPVYTHSKLAIVDDKWLTTGNANLDGASLRGASEIARPDKLNVEVNLALFDGIEGAPATGDVAALRRRVWSEHLGVKERALADPPGDGWLDVWRKRAEANADAARHEDFGGVKGRVMPLWPDLPNAVAKAPPLMPG